MLSILSKGRAKRNRRGVTLIEVAMALAVFALVVATVMLSFQTANTQQKLAETQGQFSAVQQAIYSMYSAQPSKAGLQNATIAEALPRRMVSGASDIRHAFGGSIVVAPVSAGGTNNAYSITFSNLPHDACIKMASTDVGRNVIAITVNGTANSQALDPPSAQAQCGAGNNSSIMWTLL